MKRSTRSVASKLALFGAAVIWGGSFLIVKNSMDVMQPHMLLAFRFTIGTLLLGTIFRKKLKLINKDYLLKGGLIGVCLFLAYSLQTIGLIDTTPGKNAFLTAIYCVLVPFLLWALDKKKPDRYNIIAAVITIIGIGLVSLNSGFSVGRGDTLTLASGALYAFHVIFVSKFGKDKDPILLTIIQFAYAAVFSWIIALLFEDFPTQWSLQTISGLFYLAVFATSVALLLQNVGQKYTKPAPASIILSLEAVFGVLFSVIFYHEQITLKLLAGFLFIFIAVIISETKLSFLTRSVNAEIELQDAYEQAD